MMAIRGERFFQRVEVVEAWEWDGRIETLESMTSAGLNCVFGCQADDKGNVSRLYFNGPQKRWSEEMSIGVFVVRNGKQWSIMGPEQFWETYEPSGYGPKPTKGVA